MQVGSTLQRLWGWAPRRLASRSYLGSHTTLRQRPRLAQSMPPGGGTAVLSQAPPRVVSWQYEQPSGGRLRLSRLGAGTEDGEPRRPAPGASRLGDASARVGGAARAIAYPAAFCGRGLLRWLDQRRPDAGGARAAARAGKSSRGADPKSCAAVRRRTSAGGQRRPCGRTRQPVGVGGRARSPGRRLPRAARHAGHARRQDQGVGDRPAARTDQRLAVPGHSQTLPRPAPGGRPNSSAPIRTAIAGTSFSRKARLPFYCSSTKPSCAASRCTTCAHGRVSTPRGSCPRRRSTLSVCWALSAPTALRPNPAECSGCRPKMVRPTCSSRASTP